MSDYKNTKDQSVFSNKIAFNIDGFTYEPVVQCDVQFVENTFINNSK